MSYNNNLYPRFNRNDRLDRLDRIDLLDRFDRVDRLPRLNRYDEPIENIVRRLEQTVDRLSLDLDISRRRLEDPREIRELRDRNVRFIPAVDIVDQETELIVQIDLPGVDKNEIEIYVRNDDRADVLVVNGRRTRPDNVNEERAINLERDTGRFSRRIPIPRDIDRTRIAATLERGVLEIKIPRGKDAGRINVR